MNYVDAKLRVAFGKRIRARRRAMDMSQEKMAELAGLHRTYVSTIERGGQSVSLDNAAKIAKVLNVSLSELFERLG
ncbi:helix-turn-helix transcriptional regulator [Nocardia vulneris]|uniref:helix-turn-helix domain-containing protein n=1 Tax=Nocardia vulneris TaxID=1141657 RepID=UPI0030CF7E7A